MTDNRYGEMLLYGGGDDFIFSGGRKYYICCGFRSVLRIIRFIEEGGSADKAADMFFLYDKPENAAELMIGFIGKEYMPSERKAFSFYGDAALIAGAFMQCYGIDILAHSSDSMHWHRFCSLFASLDGECSFSKIIKCRCGDFQSALCRTAARRLAGKYRVRSGSNGL